MASLFTICFLFCTEIVNMADGGKGHRKKKSGRKADKRKAAETKKKGTDDGNNDAARKQNPKAFIFKSRGKAKIQRARTAEKDQRRMHGTCIKIENV